MRSPFLDRLERGAILGDGAMGTQLYARGIQYERCFDELNLSEPALVQRIHREYIRAGAELIETNTYGANRYKLAQYGLEDRVRDINFRAVKLAREAREEVGDAVFLAGAIGPLGQGVDGGAVKGDLIDRPVDHAGRGGRLLLLGEGGGREAEQGEGQQRRAGHGHSQSEG